MNIQIKNLPQLLFAHIYNTDKYNSQLYANNNLIEITFITQGKATLQQNGTYYYATENDVITNCYTSPLSLYSNEPHTHHTVCFRVEFNYSETPEINYLSIPLITTPKTNRERISQIITEIIQTNTLHTESMLTCSGLFLQLLDLLNESNKQNVDKINYSNLNYINKAKNYIYNNLNRPIQQNEIAEYLKISPQYLCAIFKKTEGIAVTAYINTLKLKKIKSLMEKEHLKLYQASEIYGYTDPNYVSKIYKKYFRMNITDVITK